MTETAILIATVALILAAIMIPIPPRGRAILWAAMLVAIISLWVGVSVG